jgi:hypothetical protein
MKKLLLLVLLLFSFIGTSSAGEVEIRKLKESNTCVNCDLRQANLSWENLSGANLSWSDLKGANLRGANLTGANLTGAYLAKANLESSKLSKANLEQTNLKEANLKGAYLKGANLKGANLKGAYLYRADLTNANLIGVNLTEANLTGANLTGAIKKEEKTSETLKKEQDLIALELEVSRLWVEGSGKTRNEIRKELKKKIINGGYKSFTSMIKEEERKKKEEERKKKEEERKKKESEQRALSSKDYPGFRDLKPGLHYEEVLEICPLQKIDFWGQIDDEGKSSNWVKCYGIDNIKFKAHYFFEGDFLSWLTLDMGPIVNTDGFLSVFGQNDSNILIKMQNTMDKKYTLDYGYSERDRQLFNESEKSNLYRVYSKGQIILEIVRQVEDYSSNLFLYIHYLDPTHAEIFLKENRPVIASEDDF